MYVIRTIIKYTLFEKPITLVYSQRNIYIYIHLNSQLRRCTRAIPVVRSLAHIFINQSTFAISQYYLSASSPRGLVFISPSRVTRNICAEWRRAQTLKCAQRTHINIQVFLCVTQKNTHTSRAPSPSPIPTHTKKITLDMRPILRSSRHFTHFNSNHWVWMTISLYTTQHTLSDTQHSYKRI